MTPVEAGFLALMPGALDEPACFGVKLLSLFPGNPAVGLSSHLGLVLLFEPEHGRPVAMMDAAEITAIRTAAVSGVATRLLARQDAGDLAILGSGEQAGKPPGGDAGGAANPAACGSGRAAPGCCRRLSRPNRARGGARASMSRRAWRPPSPART